MTKIVAISDIHGNLPEIEPADILCICGDVSPLGIDRKVDLAKEWLNTEFIEWINNLPIDNIVMIGGNHDFGLQEMSKVEFVEWTKKSHKLQYLEDSCVVLNDIMLYGSPWCPRLSNWAFYKDNSNLKRLFNNIPDCDILLTHTPPKYVNGVGEVRQESKLQYRDSIPDHGCQELRDAIKHKNIKYVFSGHIHSGNHNIEEWRGKKLANVSLLNEDYHVFYKPLIIEI
jgi:Icc-related predicted phosphoesterase